MSQVPGFAQAAEPSQTAVSSQAVPSAGTGRLRLPRAGRHLLVTAAYVVVIAGSWAWYVRAAHVPAFLLPAPGAVWDEVTSLASTGQLWGNVAYTVRNIVIGFASGIVIGVFLGYLLWVSRWAREILAPYIVLFQALPKIALAPALVLWFGLGLPSQLALILMLSFFPIMVSTALGLRGIPGELAALGRLLGMGRWAYFRAVQFPGSLPSLFAGAKIAIVDAMTGAFLAEYIAAQRGLGYLMVVGTSTYNSAELVAAVLITITIGLLGFLAITRAERLVIRWQPTT
ncbi:MAG TPA: ABC transporter permease [Trebonia sp.]|nr:ABC transporter permease [Trebonia sp.]